MRDWDAIEIATVALMVGVFAVVLAVSPGCSNLPKDYKRGALADQVLRPLPGHTGLVNSECTHNPKTGACTWDYGEYDLNDAPTRQRLRDAGFICTVSGRAYRIASLKPGLIFETYDQSCFLGFICGSKTAREVDYIPISNYQSLIDQKTECFSAVTYNYYEGHSE